MKLPGFIQRLWTTFNSPSKAALWVLLLMGFFGGVIRIDRRVIVHRHVTQNPGDEIDMLFDRDHDIADHRRTAGPCDGQQIRKTGADKAEILLGAIMPLIAQAESIAAPHIH